MEGLIIHSQLGSEVTFILEARDMIKRLRYLVTKYFIYSIFLLSRHLLLATVKMIVSFPNEIFTERSFSSEDKPECFASSVKGRVVGCVTSHCGTLL